MILSNRNEEDFIIILLSIVSSNFVAVDSDTLQLCYVGRRIFISVVRKALLVDWPPG